MRMNIFSTMATMVAKVIGASTCSTEVPAKREVSAGTDCSRMPATTASGSDRTCFSASGTKVTSIRIAPAAMATTREVTPVA